MVIMFYYFTNKMKNLNLNHCVTSWHMRKKCFFYLVIYRLLNSLFEKPHSQFLFFLWFNTSCFITIYFLFKTEFYCECCFIQIHCILCMYLFMLINMCVFCILLWFCLCFILISFILTDCYQVFFCLFLIHLLF